MRNIVRHLPLILAFSVSCSAICCGDEDAGPSAEESDNSAVDQATQGLPTDRKTLSVLEGLRADIAAGRLRSVRDDFRRLKTSDALLMVPASDKEGVTFVPLYRGLWDVFFQLPEALQQEEASRTEAQAGRQFAEILDTSAFEQIPELILAAPGTEASMRAHLLMASLHADRHNTAGARYWLTPLLNSAVPQEFQEAARQLEEQLPAAEETHVSTGDVSAGDSNADLLIPAHVRWVFRAAPSTAVRTQIREFLRAAREAGVVAETAWRSVAEAGSVFTKTVRGMAAVNTEDGTPRWHYPLLPGLDSELSSARKVTSGFRQPLGATSGSSLRFHQLQNTFLADAFCRDNVYGQITTDDRYIYLATTDPDSEAVAVTTNRMFGTRTSARPFRNGRVVALEKATGRRVWSAGVETFRERLSGESPTLWIAGPPVAYQGRLYCVVEWNGEIRLVCLNRETGEPLWSCLLSFPDQTIDVDAVRRLWSGTPIVREGMAWCRTTSGWTTCVELLTQTVVWNSRLQSSVEGQTYTVARGRPVAITTAAHLFQRWPVSRLFLSSGRLVHLPHESHEIAVLNAVSGEPIHRITVLPGTIFCGVDAGRVVLAEQSAAAVSVRGAGPSQTEQPPVLGRLRCLNLQTADELWEEDLSEESGLPTGEGAVVGGRLLLPMTTGKIAAVEIRSGQISLTTDVVLPRHGWGYLSLLPDSGETPDLLYSAPDVQMRLSSMPPEETPRSTLEVAISLFENEQWQQAIERLRDIPQTSADFEPARRLEFRSLLNLVRKDPERWMPELKQAVRSASDRIHVRLAEIDWLQQQGKTSEAISELADLMSQDFRLLQANHDARYLTSSSRAVRRPLLTVACELMTKLLDQTEDSAAASDAVRRLPVSQMLRLQHSAVRPVLHAYLQTADLTEESLHAVLHSLRLADLQKDATPDVTAELQTLAGFIRDVLEGADKSAARRAALQMLSAVAAEMSSDRRAQLNDLLKEDAYRIYDADIMSDDYRKRLKDQYDRWARTNYRTIPVARMSTVGQSAKRIVPAINDDLFLREYVWSVIPGSPSRLQAVEMANSGEVWSVPGLPGSPAVTTGRCDQLLRSGPVLLHAAYTGLNALSAIDQRVLWSASPQVSSSRTGGVTIGTSGFHDFVNGRQRLPSAGFSSLNRIVAAGHDWVCLQSGSELRVVQTLTGDDLWSCGLADGNNQLAATEEVVFVSGTETDEVSCFDRLTGKPCEVSNAADLVSRAMTSAGSRLVCWKPAKGDAPAAIEWIDPRDSQVAHRVSLAGFSHFTFADDTTLAGFNASWRAIVVDLRSGRSETFSFTPQTVAENRNSPAAHDKETQKATAETAKPDVPKPGDGGDAQGPPMWHPSRIQLSLDAFNFYLSNRPRSLNTSMLPANRQMTAFEGGLQAVSRSDFKQLWSIAADHLTLAATDQPELPFLILVETRPLDQQQAASMAAVNVFRAVDRFSGQEVFRHSVTSQYGLRYTQIVSRHVNSLDLSVFGQRFRITADAAADERK